MNRRRSPHVERPVSARRVLVLASLFLLLPGLAAPALAGRLEGKIPRTISDLRDLRIVIQNVDTHRTWTVSAGPDGKFSALDLPAGRVIVYAVQAGDEVPEAIGATSIDGEGITRLSLTAVPKSSEQSATFNFTLYRGEYYNNKPNDATADPVTVSDSQTTSGIDIGMSPGGGTISGHVSADGTGAPISNIVVVALGLSSFISSFDRTDASGNYTITGIPAGTYWVSVNTLSLSIDNDYVEEYFDNSRTSTTATPVTVTEGANTPNINFALTLGGSISGTIFSGVVPGQGLPFALVTVHSVADPNFSAAVLTGAGGTYRVRGLPAGLYTVVAEAETYVTEYYDNAPSSDLATKVQVNAGADRTGTDITLSGGGVIQGVVQNQNTGQPLAGYVVTAANLADQTSRSGITDDAGTYTIEGLATGDYAVGVPDLNRWYDNRSTFETATPVHVTAPSTVSNINITGVPAGTAACAFQPSQVGRITGTVRQAAGGTPLPGAQVWLYLHVTDELPMDSATSDLNGVFALECIAPGTYFVRAAVPFTRFLPMWYAAGTPAPITVTAGGTQSGVDFSLATGGAISGRVTIEGALTGIEGVIIVAKNTTTLEEFTDLTGANGNYVIDSGFSGGVPPGPYKVRTDDYSTARLEYVPVELSRFTASWSSAGVLLQWTATDAAQYSGFHVYRSSGTEAPVRITADLLTGGPAFEFTDAGAVAGETYRYWLGAVDRGGEESRFGPIAASPGEPSATRLLGVAPNPVRASAVVRFSLASAGPVSLRVFDLSGRLIRILADGIFPAGMTAVSWNARAESGDEVPAGVYYVALSTPGKSTGASVVVVR